MRKTVLIATLTVVVALISTMFIIACGGGGGGGGDRDAILGTVSTNPGLTTIKQKVPLEDSGGEFIGYANYWDLQNDMEINDGGDDQFDDALTLTVGLDTFPSDQDYTELTWMTPDMDSSDGLPIPAVADSVYGSDSAYTGTYAAYLPGGPADSLFQVLDLSAAAGTVTLSWAERIWNNLSGFDNDPNDNYSVILSAASTGSHLETLRTFTDDNSVSWAVTSADLTAYAGTRVKLAFEARTSGEKWVVVDDVSVTDTGGPTEFVTNGDFEAGDLTGWSYVEPVYSTNVTSGARTLDGLTVTRSFFTYPEEFWGRMVDVFENTTGSAIATTVEYNTDLGNDDYGIIYYTPGTGNTALTSWDGDGGDRDIGWVFGSADDVEFTNDTGLGDGSGDEDMYVRFGIDVPAGGTVAIVNFIIMNGVDTYETASDITARATAIDNAAQAIVEDFWSNGIYRDGMTQDQIDAILNF